MAAAQQEEKTFYLETFGCQMNAHDSEKVVGTLVSQGYRQVPTVEEAGLVLYNTCSIRDKAEQKVFHRLADYKKLRVLVEKTGGPREHEAFDFLQAYVDRTLAAEAK